MGAKDATTNVINTEYISIGANRITNASAWSSSTGLLAYGADNAIALWKVLDPERRGVNRLLTDHHDDKVTALSFLEGPSVPVDARPQQTLLLSGAADGEIAIWEIDDIPSAVVPSSRCTAHAGAVNVLVTVPGTNYVLTGGADATIKAWHYQNGQLRCVSSLLTAPRFIPLAIAAEVLPDYDPRQSFFFAAAGTRNDVFIYAMTNVDGKMSINLSCSLTGHEGWIRSLSFTRNKDKSLLLASTSSDKYVRLWRFQAGFVVTNTKSRTADDVLLQEVTLTSKVKTVGIDGHKYSITFDALLLGHEDWVYSADWRDSESRTNKLLTASADGTLAIWEPDEDSGIWVSETRLGEISGQKGATTATGSSGGFWKGIWIANSVHDEPISAVVSLGRTGSWRIWRYDVDSMYWNLHSGIGGHTSSVNSLCWPQEGEYLLTTGSDQTTRLHAEWKREDKRTWHEFSRPQIHGYDLNCITAINPSQFVSGADEKLLRVFNEPKDLASTLFHLCGIEVSKDATLADSAAIPVLGLSNKVLGEPDDHIEAGPRGGDEEYAAANVMAGFTIEGITEPPTEDLLARHTLWPEHEKLYGHGYEISDAAYCPYQYCRGILATACKASSIDHAVIILYDTKNDWRRATKPLTSHSLTITRLAWSYPSTDGGGFLLSVGRDRQWTLFSADSESHILHLYQAMPKAHSRMILDAAWCPSSTSQLFATAARDKTVNFWHRDPTNQNAQFELKTKLIRPTAVTAIDFVYNPVLDIACLAVGEENGSLSVYSFNASSLQQMASFDIPQSECPSKAINRLRWRMNRRGTSGSATAHCSGHLAVASADGCTRVIMLSLNFKDQFSQYSGLSDKY